MPSSCRQTGRLEPQAQVLYMQKIQLPWQYLFSDCYVTCSFDQQLRRHDKRAAGPGWHRYGPQTTPGYAVSHTGLQAVSGCPEWLR